MRSVGMAFELLGIKKTQQCFFYRQNDLGKHFDWIEMILCDPFCACLMNDTVPTVLYYIAAASLLSFVALTSFDVCLKMRILG